jgi:hypothetical protein
MNVGSGKTLTLGGNLTGSGTINSVTIGQSLAAAGSFTTLSAAGNVTLGDSTTDTITLTGTVQPGVVISGSSSGDALRITQTGAGNALLVEDAANPDSTPFVVTAAGDVGIGTSSPNFKLQVAGPIGATGGFSANQTATAGFDYQSATNNSRFFSWGPVGTVGGFTWFQGSGGNSATNTMTLDSSGNLGLGVTPSGWGTNYTALQIGNSGTTGSFIASSSTAIFGQNFYRVNAGTEYYIYSTIANKYSMDSGGHKWYTAPSGTAGATTSITSGQVYTVTTLGSTTLGQWQAYFSGLSAIPSVGQSITATATGTLAGGATVTQTITFTQAMTLDASGNLGVGTTSSPVSKLHVNDGSIRLSNSAGSAFGISIFSNGQSSGQLMIGHAYVTPSDNIAYFQNQSNAALVFGTNATERVRIGSGGEVYFLGVGTTASAANAFLNNGSTPANQLLRSTSSLRYKTDVETLDHAKADAVLNLRPVWYRSKAEADRKDWSWYGLIAEEVAQVEPRLVHWSYPEDQFETIETQTEIEKTREVEVTPAVLDDEGNVVEPAVTETETYTETETKSERKLKTDAQLAPDGVQYDRLTVMLLDIVKRQNQRIEQLEAKVAALETQ